MALPPYDDYQGHSPHDKAGYGIQG